MSVLVDTSFYVALRQSQDPFHRPAVRLADEILRGAHGQTLITDYIVAEILNFASSRIRTPAILQSMLAELTGKATERWVNLTFVDQESFAVAAALYSTLGVRKGLSFTDCTTLAVARRLHVDLLASFDAGFDGLMNRLS